MVDVFSKRKEDVLAKLDKSSVGGWDEKVKELCGKINSLDDYYTTSSCSGRAVVMKDQEKKAEGLFVWVCHDLVELGELKKCLNGFKDGKLKFKCEPCILHVACKDLECAQVLLDKAKLSGWKKSGIIASEKRFVVELNGTDRLEFPVFSDKLLVGDEFLEKVVEKSNYNLKRSWGMIEKLFESL